MRSFIIKKVDQFRSTRHFAQPDTKRLPMYTTLKTLKVGERARVSGYAAGCPGYRHRLLTMGLTPGTEIRVTRLAPLGDPVEVEVRGYSLSLRKDEAEVLQVQRGCLPE